MRNDDKESGTPFLFCQSLKIIFFKVSYIRYSALQCHLATAFCFIIKIYFIVSKTLLLPMSKDMNMKRTILCTGPFRHFDEQQGDQPAITKECLFTGRVSGSAPSGGLAQPTMPCLIRTSIATIAQILFSIYYHFGISCNKSSIKKYIFST